MSGAELLRLGEHVLAPNYGAPGIALVRGEGARVWDADGREYIDFGSGISVTSFGHRHPAIHEAVRAQLDALWHASNLYATEPAVRLADELVRASFAERVFFCNSGTEANEAAIKAVRKAASTERPPERRVILTFEGGFHGRTLAAVTATAQPKYHAGFEPLPGGFRYCPFNDVEALERHFDDSVCAVLVEPVQGEGGVVPAEPGFLASVRALCDRFGAYLVVDEVQCGLSRTGRLWAHEWEEGVRPDAMTLAKALGGGLPIGALLLGSRLADALGPGSLGSTFGGNPVACAGARAALALAESAPLRANVAAQGARLREALSVLVGDVFDEVRGRGLMLGAVLGEHARDALADILAACRARGVLVLQAGPSVLRFLPPLIVDAATVDEAMSRLRAALADTLD